MLETKITVPTYKETDSKPYLLTDFAVANGAACNIEWKKKDGMRSKSGCVWLRSAYSIRSVRARGLHGDDSGGYAGSRSFGSVLPRFQNPQSLGISTSIASGKSVLTINGKTVLYPQSYAGEKMSEELMEAVKSGSIQAVGEYASDGESIDFDLINKPYSKKTSRSFLYNGEMYCYVEKAMTRDSESVFRNGTSVEEGKGYWFVCEPIQAEQCPDGSIQCKELLVPCQFEPQDKYEALNLKSGQELDTDQFAIGKFLGGDFLRDLQRSVEDK